MPDTKLKKHSRISVNYKLIYKILIVILLFTAIISAGTSWVVTHPSRYAVGDTPASVGLAYNNVTFPSRVDNVELKGWFLPSKKSASTVIIAHGYRNNRLQDDVPSLAVAKELINAGYNVLLFDFRNCGESSGNITTFGKHEVKDLLGAIDYVRQSPDVSQHIALLGFSMGAGTAILAGCQETAVDAVIADSPFANLNKHLSEKSFPVNYILMPVLTLLTGLDPKQVSPAREVASLVPRPLMLIHGDADRVVPAKNSKEIFQAAGDNASLWIVQGADHLQSYNIVGKEYTDRIIEFLNKSLF